MSGEERATTDDSSSETESPPAGTDEKCPYCGIYKVMAESRLFKLPEALVESFERSFHETNYYFLDERPIPFQYIENGSNKGCQFCKLLIDATTVWGKEQGVDGLELGWRLELRAGQFLIEVGIWSDACDNVIISRGTGFQSQWNIREDTMQISGDTSSPAAVATAHRWLEDCKDNHEHCKRESHSQKSPKRILKLDGKQVELCENPEPAIDYACLSHCWGPYGPAMQLRPDTMADLKAGILLNALPKTFRDAAWFCWRLGIHYIWIDALCIVQGDKADWEEAAATMADVYEGAVITLAASWSSSSEDGCFAPATHDIALSEGGLYLRDGMDVFPRSAMLTTSNRWPLFHRAWVLQERMMSTRVLHFGKQELFWECKSKLLSESDMEGSEHSCFGLKSHEVEEDPESGWRNVVEHYSKLRLTYEKDRLPAISAVVKRMQQLRQDDVYIAGMWEKTLHHDLCWQTIYGQKLARPDRPGFVMPSWSWISTSPGVFCHNYLVPLLSPDDITVVYNITGPAHIGQVSHASIHLKARFLVVKPDLTDFHPFRILEHPDGIWGNDGPLLESDGSRWDFDFRTADPPMNTDETFVALLLSRDKYDFCFCIVLRELANGQFERVGCNIFKVPKRSDDSESEPAWLLGLLRLPIGEFTIV